MVINGTDNSPMLISTDLGNYTRTVSNVVKPLIKDNVENNGFCSIMLTDGRTTDMLYKFWEDDSSFTHESIHYYFGDERCVPVNHQESIYGMVLQSLFKGIIYDQCDIHRITGDAENIIAEALRYTTILPDSIDILLLSVGTDGHIASLFPNSESLAETEKSVIAINNSPKLPSKRITITQKVIKSAKNIIVMAVGEIKGNVLAEALHIPSNIEEMPVCQAHS